MHFFYDNFSASLNLKLNILANSCHFQSLLLPLTIINPHHRAISVVHCITIYYPHYIAVTATNPITFKNNKLTSILHTPYRFLGKPFRLLSLVVVVVRVVILFYNLEKKWKQNVSVRFYYFVRLFIHSFVCLFVLHYFSINSC